MTDSSNPPSDVEYELWREVWTITEWKDDSIFHTKKTGEGWFAAATVQLNVPRETNLLYVAGGPNAPLVAIRRKYPAGWDKV